MKSWNAAWRDGIRSGSLASLTSTAALSICGECENGSPHAPTNAISHWLWGERAEREDGASVRYTAVGYAIHHASATLWAVIYEKWFGTRAERRDVAAASAGAAVVASLACVVDLTLTPPRLRPGFEKRLSTGSLILVYGAFAAGLAVRGLAARTLAQGDCGGRRPPEALLRTSAPELLPCRSDARVHASPPPHENPAG